MSGLDDTPREWWIYLTHPTGNTQVQFRGTEMDAAKKAASYIGKPASWNVNKDPHEPNLWDTYETARIREVPPLVKERTT